MAKTRSEINRQWRERNHDADIERKKKWRTENPDNVKAIQARARANNRDSINLSAKRYRAENAEELTYKQRRRRNLPEPTRPRPEVCEVCGCRNGSGGVHLDHNHETGEFRGWLCMKCNMALGLLNDSLDLLRALTDYLERN